MKQKILQKIPTECPWRDTLYWYDATDSTNTQAKHLARDGAPHGTVVIAGAQSAGRGRLGRSFDSQAGMGVYLSLVLRPACPPEKLMHLTCAAGVAMCDAVEQVAGIRPGIKWINDLVLNKRKLGGILTELSVDPKTGLVDYAIVGIGINCLQSKEDFPAELQSIATSLSAAGKEVAIHALAGSMVEALWKMDSDLFSRKAQLMDAYRSDCITLGEDILIHRGDTVTAGKAQDVDSDGALVALLPNGKQICVNSGEVSVRGLYSYI